MRFGQSPERLAVLDGLLRYRAALHKQGLVAGFQWVDGSFLEHIEIIESRPPNDVDVVTFYRLPAGKSQGDLARQAPELFPQNAAAKKALKASFHVDAYLVGLEIPPERLTQQSAYWYSIWSHRRNQVWKGFVQIDLAPTNDADAAKTLAGLVHAGAHP